MTKKIAYILGGAACVWEDFERATGGLALGDFDVIAVNDVGCEYKGELAAWCSLHGWQLLRQWMPRRTANGFEPAAKTISGLDAGDQAVCRDNLTLCTEAKFPGQDHGGASGLFAVKAALDDLGYDRVILCGIPMTDMPHFFKSDQDTSPEGQAVGWHSATSYWEGWKEAEPHLRGRCFSMSGWTREFLGAPPGLEDEPTADQEEGEEGDEQLTFDDEGGVGDE